MQVELKAGGRWLPVTIEKKKRKLALSFRYYPPLIEEIKCMRGAKFERNPNRWEVTDCPRNEIQLEALQGRRHPALARYFEPLRDFKPTRPILKPHQIDMARWQYTKRGVVLAAEMGCIDGEAIVHTNRGGKGRAITLARLFFKQNGGLDRGWPQTRWDPKIPTRIRVLTDHGLRLNEVVKVLDKGVKAVVILFLKSGKSVRLTPDHEVATAPGEFRRVRNLKPGDIVLTNGKFIDKDGYVRVHVGRYSKHPRMWCGYVYEHILVAEKELGRFIRRSEHVHHKNRVKHDNRFSNLEVSSRKRHLQEHGEQYANNFHTSRNPMLPFDDEVVKVVPDGTAHVYDVVCADPWRNFVADGVVVHNCGKTLPTIEVIERVLREHALPETGYIQKNPNKRVHHVWYVGPKQVLTSIKLEFKKWKTAVQPLWVTFNRLHRVLEEYGGQAPLFVVFDEASFLKGKGPWYQAAQLLADEVRRERDGWNVLLTGTPAPLNPTDWHSLVEIACPGLIREATKGALERRVAVHEKMDVGTHQFNHVIGWKQPEVEKLGRRIAPATMVVYAAEVQKHLPPLREERINLEPSPAMLRAARLIANTAMNSAQALNKIRQLSDGFQYHENDDGADRCDTPKDKALTALLSRNRETGRVLIYAPYTESIDRCVDLCLNNGWSVLRVDGRGQARFRVAKNTHKKDTNPAGNYEGEDDKLGSEWLLNLDRTQDPHTVHRLAMVAHPLSGGYGWNLTAARSGVCYSCDFDWGTHAQMKKRGHREGMDLDAGFTMFYLCHLPTDEYVLDNHQQKKDLQGYALDQIRALFK